MIKAESVPIIIEDGDGNIVAEYFIKKRTVAISLRQSDMFGLLDTKDEKLKGYYFQLIALACTLCDKNGNLLYPEKDYPDLSVFDEFDDINLEVFQILTKAYTEINPIEPTLSAKKKKS